MGERALLALLALGGWAAALAAQPPCTAMPQNRFGQVKRIVLETNQLTGPNGSPRRCTIVYEFDPEGFRTLLSYDPDCFPSEESLTFDQGLVDGVVFERVEVQHQAPGFYQLRALFAPTEHAPPGLPEAIRLPENMAGGGPLDLQKIPPGAILVFGEGPRKPQEVERQEVEVQWAEHKEIWRFYDSSGLVWTREYTLNPWCYPVFQRETKWTGETLLTWYLYDDKHCLVKTVFWQPGRGEVGGLWSLEWLAYGEQGFPALRCLGLTGFWCTYFHVDEVEFDSYGNWIKRRVQVCNDDGSGSQVQCQPPMLQKRTIAYFP